MRIHIKKELLYCLFYIAGISSCKKLVEIEPPVNSITTQQTFADSIDALSAVAGAYYTISTGSSLQLLNGSMTVYPGISSDELVPYGPFGDILQLYSNNVLAGNNATAGNNTISNYLWTPGYKIIYQLNAIINGVEASSGMSETAKNGFSGEAKFLRALTYFYLVNLFGDVPYITTTDYKISALASRTPKDQVYQSIIADLKSVQTLLPGDYAAGGGDRIRANKWAATALLARVYLYKGDYANAASQSASVINNTGLFELNADLTKVFLRNDLGNNEAILQWLPNTSQYPMNATPEGNAIIPNASKQPRYYLSNQLFNAFEPGDQRRIAWVDSTIYSGKAYYYPYKYKIGSGQAVVNTIPTEYPTVLRLAEQYLIHAEALAQQGTDLGTAIADLNAIRSRAGLSGLSTSLTKDQVLSAVAQERRIELFAEWGHRWLDLQRTGQIDAVMTLVTPLKNGGTAWRSYQQLYPIPFYEIKADPNLTQNSGY